MAQMVQACGKNWEGVWVSEDLTTLHTGVHFLVKNHLKCNFKKCTVNCFTCNAGNCLGGTESEPKPTPAQEKRAESLAGVPGCSWQRMWPGEAVQLAQTCGFAAVHSNWAPSFFFFLNELVTLISVPHENVLGLGMVAHATKS